MFGDGHSVLPIVVHPRDEGKGLIKGLCWVFWKGGESHSLEEDIMNQVGAECDWNDWIS